MDVAVNVVNFIRSKAKISARAKEQCILAEARIGPGALFKIQMKMEPDCF